MNFNEKIDEIAKKFNYNAELTEALKRCVPVMAKGKSKPEVELLMDTLERVEIFDFKEIPTKEQLDEIEKAKVAGRNEHVNFIENDSGEYGQAVAPGAYNSIPVFDENMKVVDRVGFIHLTRLSKYSKIADFYGTTINLSHLVHELGHAWASQKDEYIQDENGNIACHVGTATLYSDVDKESHTVTETRTKGLFMEEALNTLEEEKALFEILNVKSIKEIPGYIPSVYQGLMESTMQSFVEKTGELPFSKLRILRDGRDLEQYQSILESTEAREYQKTDEWTERKRRTFDRVSELDYVSDDTKKVMKDFFAKYDDVYFSSNSDEKFWEKLDNVLEQLYNFKAIQYNFNIMKSEKNKEIYSDIQLEMLREAMVPLNEAEEKIDEYNKSRSNVSIRDLAKQALQTRTT